MQRSIDRQTMHNQASFAKSSTLLCQPLQNLQKATGKHKPSARHP